LYLYQEKKNYSIVEHMNLGAQFLSWIKALSYTT